MKDLRNYILRRAINFFVDSFFIALLTIIILIIIDASKISYGVNRYIIYMVCWFSYYYIFELAFSRTIAKFITRTYVECHTTRKAFFLLIRTITRLIPLEPLSLFFSEDNTMWHDSLSKTRVVKAGIT